MRRVLTRCAIVVAVLCAGGASAALAADGISGTWSTGPGQDEQTFVFRVQGNSFIGIVCGPCDDPKTVFRVADGRLVDATRFTFAIVHDDGGPLFARIGPYRNLVSGTWSGTRMTLQARPEGGREDGTSVVLSRVTAKRGVAGSAGAPPTAAAIDGRWVAAGRVAQQNVTLKVRGNKIAGVICGPCDDPDGVFLIEDGILEGSTISFYIHHIDTPVASVQANGGGRNFMKGTIVGNVMRFKWVREGRENEPGGEMVLMGPLREAVSPK
jgi:hypothetical protein